MNTFSVPYDTTTSQTIGAPFFEYNMVLYDTGEIIRSGYKAYYRLSCSIPVHVSVIVLESLSNNILHDTWNEKVLVGCFFPFTNSAREHTSRECYT